MKSFRMIALLAGVMLLTTNAHAQFDLSGFMGTSNQASNSAGLAGI